MVLSLEITELEVNDDDIPIEEFNLTLPRKMEHHEFGKRYNYSDSNDESGLGYSFSYHGK